MWVQLAASMSCVGLQTLFQELTYTEACIALSSLIKVLALATQQPMCIAATLQTPPSASSQMALY